MAHVRSWWARLPAGWPRAAAAIGVLLLLYGCWQVFRWPQGHRPLVGDLFFLPADAIAIATAWRASSRCSEQRRLRLAWKVLAAAFASYLAGDLAWTIYELGRD